MSVIYSFFYLISNYAFSLVPAFEQSVDKSAFLLTAFFIGMGFVGGILGAIIGYVKIDNHLNKGSKSGGLEPTK
jgi:hypothetical protein